MLALVLEPVLGPVVLDLVVVEDHVGGGGAQQPGEVGRAERLEVARLELLGVRAQDRHHPVQHVGVDLVAEHQGEPGGVAEPVAGGEMLEHRAEDPAASIFQSSPG